MAMDLIASPAQASLIDEYRYHVRAYDNIRVGLGPQVRDVARDPKYKGVQAVYDAEDLKKYGCVQAMYDILKPYYHTQWFVPKFKYAIPNHRMIQEISPTTNASSNFGTQIEFTRASAATNVMQYFIRLHLDEMSASAVPLPNIDSLFKTTQGSFVLRYKGFDLQRADERVDSYLNPEAETCVLDWRIDLSFVRGGIEVPALTPVTNCVRYPDRVYSCLIILFEMVFGGNVGHAQQNLHTLEKRFTGQAPGRQEMCQRWLGGLREAFISRAGPDIDCPDASFVDWANEPMPVPLGHNGERTELPGISFNPTMWPKENAIESFPVNKRTQYDSGYYVWKPKQPPFVVHIPTPELGNLVEGSRPEPCTSFALMTSTRKFRFAPPEFIKLLGPSNVRLQARMSLCCVTNDGSWEHTGLSIRVTYPVQFTDSKIVGGNITSAMAVAEALQFRPEFHNPLVTVPSADTFVVPRETSMTIQQQAGTYNIQGTTMAFGLIMPEWIGSLRDKLVTEPDSRVYPDNWYRTGQAIISPVVKRCVTEIPLPSAPKLVFDSYRQLLYAGATIETTYLLTPLPPGLFQGSLAPQLERAFNPLRPFTIIIHEDFIGYQVIMEDPVKSIKQYMSTVLIVPQIEQSSLHATKVNALWGMGIDKDCSTVFMYSAGATDPEMRFGGPNASRVVSITESQLLQFKRPFDGVREVICMSNSLEMRTSTQQHPLFS